MSKLVIIAGIKRSGSTWMYNVARLALNEAGFTTFGGGPETYFNFQPRSEDYHLIKVHPYDPKLVQVADVILTSERDLKEVARSLNRCFGSNPTQKRLDWMQMCLGRWMDHSDYHITFDQVGSEEAVKGICKALGVPYPAGLADRVNAIKPPTDAKQDRVTLLFRNHITSR